MTVWVVQPEERGVVGQSCLNTEGLESKGGERGLSKDREMMLNLERKKGRQMRGGYDFAIRMERWKRRNKEGSCEVVAVRDQCTNQRFWPSRSQPRSLAVYS